MFLAIHGLGPFNLVIRYLIYIFTLNNLFHRSILKIPIRGDVIELTDLERELVRCYAVISLAVTIGSFLEKIIKKGTARESLLTKIMAGEICIWECEGCQNNPGN